MTVIGRLDDQVNAVLIEPLRRKDKPNTADQQQPEQTESAQPQTQPLAAPDEPRAEHAPDDLPVWLL